MESVFPRSRESLMSIDHLLTTAGSFCNNNSMLVTYLSETKMAESSAYKNIFFVQSTSHIIDIQ